MSPSDLPDYLQAVYHDLPEHRRADYLLAMLEGIAITEGRASRVPMDPDARRRFGRAMSEADDIAAWLATYPFPGPMPPSRPARARTAYRPVSDRDMARSGAVG